MKTISCTQGTPEWLKARAGIPTASEFDNLVTPEWKLRTGQTPETYLYRKLAERCMGVPLQTGGGSWEMGQGSILEGEALPFVMFTRDIQIDRVGFVTTDDGRIGCSPDGLIGTDGGIEAKCPQPDTHLRYLVNGELPPQYRAQVYGSMLVTDRKWWYFLSYSRQFPPLLLRIERDEKIMAALQAALNGFLATFDAAYAKVMALKEAADAPKRAAYEAQKAEYEATGKIPD
jgi:hypothetical protein